MSEDQTPKAVGAFNEAGSAADEAVSSASTADKKASVLPPCSGGRPSKKYFGGPRSSDRVLGLNY